MGRKFLTMYKEEFNNYDFRKFRKDILAGITVAFVSLPLALALGVANGIDARAGISTAIFSGIIIALLGGGSFQINGATASTVAVLSVVATTHGSQGVFLCGLISGIMIILVRILNLTKYINKIPETVIEGLASGLGLLIIVGELDNFFGINKLSGSIYEMLISFIKSLNQIHILTLSIGLVGLVFLFLYPKKLNKIIPNSLVLVIVFIILNLILNLDIKVVGEVPKALITNNRLMFESINLELVLDLIIPSINVAMLLLIKSLSSGITGSKIKKEKFRMNEEVMALGVGNMILSFLGCLPSAASISATQVGINSSGKTRITSIMNSITLMLIVFGLSKIIKVIPIVILSSILIYTGYKMIKLKYIKNIDFIITVTAIIFFDISIAAILGTIVSLMLNKNTKKLLIKNI